MELLKHSVHRSDLRATLKSYVSESLGSASSNIPCMLKAWTEEFPALWQCLTPVSSRCQKSSNCHTCRACRVIKLQDLEKVAVLLWLDILSGLVIFSFLVVLQNNIKKDGIPRLNNSAWSIWRGYWGSIWWALEKGVLTGCETGLLPQSPYVNWPLTDKASSTSHDRVSYSMVRKLTLANV